MEPPPDPSLAGIEQWTKKGVALARSAGTQVNRTIAKALEATTAVLKGDARAHHALERLGTERDLAAYADPAAMLGTTTQSMVLGLVEALQVTLARVEELSGQGRPLSLVAPSRNGILRPTRHHSQVSSRPLVDQTRGASLLSMPAVSQAPSLSLDEAIANLKKLGDAHREKMSEEDKRMAAEVKEELEEEMAVAPLEEPAEEETEEDRSWELETLPCMDPALTKMVLPKEDDDKVEMGREEMEGMEALDGNDGDSVYAVYDSYNALADEDGENPYEIEWDEERENFDKEDWTATREVATRHSSRARVRPAKYRDMDGEQERAHKSQSNSDYSEGKKKRVKREKGLVHPVKKRVKIELRSDSEDEVMSKKGKKKSLARSGSASVERKRKKARPPTPNATELECPQCEYMARTTAGWVGHLKSKHATTPTELGLAIRCQCGHTAASNTKHMCVVSGLTQFSIIKREDSGLDDRKGRSRAVSRVGSPVARKLATKREAQSDSEDDEVTMKKKGGKMSMKREPQSDSEDELMTKKKGVQKSEMVEQSDSEDDEVTMKKRKKKGPQKSEILEQSDSDDDDYGKTRKRKRVKSEKKPVARSDPLEKKKGKRTLPKPNDTELECPQCEYKATSISSWMAHLKQEHSTTPMVAGLVIKCDCGYESFGRNHTCAIRNFTIVPRAQSTMRPKDTPQCIKCEAQPSSMIAFVRHLKDQHSTTLAENGLYLRCDCGMKCLRRCLSVEQHKKKCDSREFSLHKLDENADEDEED